MVSGGTTAFHGHDATQLYRAMVLKQALGLLARGIKPNTAYTLGATLKAVTGYTGKRYTARRTSCAEASSDLSIWIATMQAALPVERED